MVRFLFRSLGWVLSTHEAKDIAFAECFQALGVEFNLADMQQGYFTVGNTRARKSELCSKIDSILDANCLTILKPLL